MLGEEGAKAKTKLWKKDGKGAEAKGGKLQREAKRKSIVTNSHRKYKA